MQTTVFAKVTRPDMAALKQEVDSMVKKIQRYVPGYSLLVAPTIEADRVVVMVRVRGMGDYLPKYAGNMDIINCAGISMAECFAQQIITNK
jgi:acetaldehyde dehydrogenase